MDQGNGNQSEAGGQHYEYDIGKYLDLDNNRPYYLNSYNDQEIDQSQASVQKQSEGQTTKQEKLTNDQKNGEQNILEKVGTENGPTIISNTKRLRRGGRRRHGNRKPPEQQRPRRGGRRRHGNRKPPEQHQILNYTKTQVLKKLIERLRQYDEGTEMETTTNYKQFIQSYYLPVLETLKGITQEERVKLEKGDQSIFRKSRKMKKNSFMNFMRIFQQELQKEIRVQEFTEFVIQYFGEDIRLENLRD